MKNNKLILAALMLVLAMVLGACGSNAQDPTDAAPSADVYSVTVVDGLGNPCNSGVIVRFMQNGTQVTMQVVNENGVAEKDLEDGAYTVELEFTGDEEYYYDSADMTLTADRKALTVTLMNTVIGEPQQLAAGEAGMVDAYRVGTGATDVALVPGQRNYFLFSPTEAGTYEFSVLNADAPIGYYGAPHFVQELSAAEVVDNKFTVSVKSSMIGSNGTGTATFVVGIDAAEETSCILGIERIGEPEYDISDEPWVIYQKTIELTPYVHSGNVAEFDITASTDTYNLVLGDDNYYHLDSADGPLVLVRLGVNPQYLDCYKTILDHTGVVAYFFDEADTFIKKESYSECLLEYFEYMDEDSGLYPLTEDLKYIIQNNGNHSGWWDEGSSIYLFKDENGVNIPGVNPEISWLFMCCYAAE